MSLKFIEFNNIEKIGDELYKELKNIIEGNIHIIFKFEENNNYYTLICTINDIIIAASVIKNNNILEYICVEEPYRKKGIGKRMISILIKKYNFLYIRPASYKSLSFFSNNFKISFNSENMYFIIESI